MCVRVQGKHFEGRGLGGGGDKVKTTEQRTDFLRESSLCGDPNEDSRGAPGAAPSCVPDTILVLRPAP